MIYYWGRMAGAAFSIVVVASSTKERQTAEPKRAQTIGNPRRNLAVIAPEKQRTAHKVQVPNSLYVVRSYRHHCTVLARAESNQGIQDGVEKLVSPLLPRSDNCRSLHLWSIVSWFKTVRLWRNIAGKAQSVLCDARRRRGGKFKTD